MKNWNLKDKVVLMRVDYNVPIKNGIIKDDTRIVKSLPTVQYILEQGAKLVIMSHLGRPLKSLLPDGNIDYANFSLQPIAEALSNLLPNKIWFATDCGGADTQVKLQQLSRGEILLLENTRFSKEEEKGDTSWAQSLASLGDYYINDAFGAAHREHATTATIARYFDKNHKAFGFLMEAEVENGKKVLEKAIQPFTAIIGGAKVSDKIDLIEKLIEKCDNILIGGGMAYTFFAAQGFPIGNSLCEPDKFSLALDLIDKAKKKNVNLCLPLDSVEADRFAADATFNITESEKINDNYMGLDIGPKTIAKYRELILTSKTIVWNGPMGVFEFKPFSKGTESIARAVAESSAKGSYSLIGGGDSVAAINAFQLENQVSFVSTGGGAMLEMLEGKQLPGVQAILEE